MAKRKNKPAVQPVPIPAVPKAADAPENDAPENDAPENDAPENDAPENDAPENDAPENDAPENENPKKSSKVVYVNVLDVRENGYKGKAGDEYKGEGLKDKDRLKYLLKRGAIRVMK